METLVFIPRLPALFLVLTGVSLGADLSGTWNLTARTPDGYKHNSVLNLQVEGTKLIGKIVSKRGVVEITNGIVDGSNVSFTVIRTGNGDELRIEFRGAVEGQTMKLRMQYRGHEPVELIAKRH